MSYALLSDDLLLQLEAAGVSRCARLLYVEGLVYCATALTDGEIRVRLTRFSDCDDVDACADELVQAGLWEDNLDSYRVLDYLDHQQSAAEVERKRADARRRAERSRRHKRGDHSLCTKSDFCPDGAVSPSSHARHTNGARDVRSPYQSNPILTDPDQREGEGKDKDGARAIAPDGAHALAPASKSPKHDQLVAGLLEEIEANNDDPQLSEGTTLTGQAFTRLQLNLPGAVVSDQGDLYYVITVNELTTDVREALDGLECLDEFRAINATHLELPLDGKTVAQALVMIMSADAALDDILRGDIDWRTEYDWKEKTP